MEETDIPRQTERIAARVIDGRAVVVVIDKRKLHAFNEVGTRVWELLEGRTVREIASALAAEFEVSQEVALKDTRHFLEELMSIGAVSIENR